MKRRAIVIVVVLLGLVAVGSTAYDHFRAGQLVCWSSPTPDGGFVSTGC